MSNNSSRLGRRDFLRLGGLGVAAATATGIRATEAGAVATQDGEAVPASSTRAPYNDVYEGARLERIAFPMGGIGGGTVCLEGTGALSHLSVRNRSDLFNEPSVFAAVHVKGVTNGTRVLEGPVPRWKVFGPPGSSVGWEHRTYGLPRFSNVNFRARFPFGQIELSDPGMPVDAQLTGWSPFVPGDADASSLPVAALEYRFMNTSAQRIEGVFSFSSRNFMKAGDHAHAVRATPGGFVLWGASGKDKPRDQDSFAITVDEPGACVNHAWFRSPWWDAFTMAWLDIEKGVCFDRPPVDDDYPAIGASLYVPFALEPGASRTVTVRLAWYVPHSFVHWDYDEDEPDKADASLFYRPWYATRFADVHEVMAFWKAQYADLRQRTERFTDCFHDSTLPPEVIEAVAANLTILKSPTVLRDHAGRLWGWEGSGDEECNGTGTCTHVWNYAQAVPHLFPSLERTLRETEFLVSQDEHGHQAFRSAMPIRKPKHTFYAAADGQLGGIVKVYRDWRIGGDTGWLRSIWPSVRQSRDHCICKWDPQRKGWVE